MIDKLINSFNNLDGKTVRRTTLEKLKNKAFDAIYENELIAGEIFRRLSKILRVNKKEKTFLIEIKNKVKNTNQPTKKDLLGMGVPFLDAPIEEEESGMNKPVSSSEIYKMITDKIGNLVKQSSGTKYKKTWGKSEFYEKDGFLLPFNFISKKAYRGVNFLMLKDADLFSVYKNPYFLTFKQIQAKKGKLKKGSKGIPVIYFTVLYKLELADYNIDFATYDKKKMASFFKKKNLPKKFQMLIQQLPIIKYYNVFNGEDVEGIDFKLDEITIGKVSKSSEENANKKHELAELILKNRPTPQISITHGGDRAYYNTGSHTIKMPKFNSFTTSLDYYRVLFHELTHSTGHHGLLNRDMTGKFGSKSYAKEELVAEFGAVFLSAQAGIIWHSNKNHEEYLKSWHKVLGIIEKDAQFLMRASSLAQKSTDYLLNLDEDKTPAFYKEFLKGNYTFKELKNKVYNFNFNKIISANTLYSHATKGYDLKENKLTDKEVAKSYAYSSFANYLIRNSKTFKEVSVNRVLSNAGEKNLIDILESEVKKRLLTVNIDISLRNQKTKNLSKTTLTKNTVASEKFVLNNLPEKYNKQIYQATIADLIRKSKPFNTDDIFRTANRNMLNLVNNRLMYLEKFKNGYFRGVEKLIYYNIPTYTFTKTTVKELAQLDTEVIKYLKNRLEDFSYQTAWIENSFRGLDTFEINSIVKYNINKITKYLEKKELSNKRPIQLELGLKKPTTKLFIEKLQVPTAIIPVKKKEEPVVNKTIETPFISTPKSAEKKIEIKPKTLKGLRSIGANVEKAPLWNIPGETGKFLQSVERKPKESVAIVLSTPAGTGKTTALYKWMNDIAPTASTLFLSLEEHPDSNLATDKRDKYLSEAAQQNINTAGSIPNKNTLFEWIEAHEVIAVDSWQKLDKLIGKIDFDTDLRKRFDGKLFIIIFQQTVDGKAKGGSDKVFDGDIIIEGKKCNNFSENYLFFDKNRYATKDLNETYYNIATHKVYNPKTISNQPKETTLLEV